MLPPPQGVAVGVLRLGRPPRVLQHQRQGVAGRGPAVADDELARVLGGERLVGGHGLARVRLGVREVVLLEGQPGQVAQAQGEHRPELRVGRFGRPLPLRPHQVAQGRLGPPTLARCGPELVPVGEEPRQPLAVLGPARRLAHEPGVQFRPAVERLLGLRHPPEPGLNAADPEVRVGQARPARLVGPRLGGEPGVDGQGPLQELPLVRRDRDLPAEPVLDHRPGQHVQRLPGHPAAPGLVLAGGDGGLPLLLGLLLLGPQQDEPDRRGGRRAEHQQDGRGRQGDGQPAGAPLGLGPRLGGRPPQLRLAEPVLRRRQVGRHLPGDGPRVRRPAAAVGGEAPPVQVPQFPVGPAGVEPRGGASQVRLRGLAADLVV